MAISDQITRIILGKSKIKAAIEAKGVPIPENVLIDAYDTYIYNIPEGGAHVEQESDKVVKIT